MTAVCLLSLQAPFSSAEALRLKQTDDSHMYPPPPDSILSPALSNQSLPHDLTAQRTIKVFEEPFREVTQVETLASTKCRHRLFAERVQRKFIVRFQDRVLPGGPTVALIDYDGIAEKDRIYLFDKFNTTACTVYSVLIK